MAALKTGSHILNINSRTGVGFKSGFDATCSCGQWRYDKIKVNYTKDEAQRFHAAHLDAVVANEQTERAE